MFTCIPQALREVVPLAERATQAVYPSPLLSPLEYKVRKMLEHLVETEQITGCQVECVSQRSRGVVLSKVSPICHSCCK